MRHAQREPADHRHSGKVRRGRGMGDLHANEGGPAYGAEGVTARVGAWTAAAVKNVLARI